MKQQALCPTSHSVATWSRFVSEAPHPNLLWYWHLLLLLELPPAPAPRGQVSQALGGSAGEVNPIGGHGDCSRGGEGQFQGESDLGEKKSFSWGCWQLSCPKGAHPLLTARESTGKIKTQAQKGIRVLTVWAEILNPAVPEATAFFSCLII